MSREVEALQAWLEVRALDTFFAYHRTRTRQPTELSWTPVLPFTHSRLS